MGQECLEEMRHKYQGGYWGTEQDRTCVSVEVIADGINPIYIEKGQNHSCQCWEQKGQTQIDMVVIEQGPIILLQPTTKRGRAWIEKNIPKDDSPQPYYPAILCEQRVAYGLIGGMILDGLNVDSVLEEDTHV